MTDKIGKQTKSSFVAFKVTPAFRRELEKQAGLNGQKTAAFVREAVQAKVSYQQALKGVQSKEG